MKIVNCSNCKKEFPIKPYRVKKQKNVFCSKGCYTKYQNTYSSENVIPRGTKFTRLKVLERSHKQGRRIYYKCQCDCEKIIIVDKRSLIAGNTKSCGCLKIDKVRKRVTKHGKHKTRLYRIWEAMRGRCNNPNSISFSYYGARGIKVCSEWEDFVTFYKWAKANGYKDNLTIERIDNDGGYAPDNCTWIPQSEQSLNTRRNWLITYKGETKTATEWAKQIGLTYFGLRHRIIRAGWTIEKALETPAYFRRR